MEEQEKYRITRELFDQIYGGIGPNTVVSLEEACLFHPVYDRIRESAYSEKFFYELVKDISRKRILSIGGGVDKVAIFLASRGNQVVSVDISPKAVAITQELSCRFNLTHALKVHELNFEEEKIPGEFDLIITHDSLHHMSLEKVLPKIHAMLSTAATFIALEPVCLSPLIKKFHEKAPFHPTPFFKGIEDELSAKDLATIKKLFTQTTLYYFDFITRESIGYRLNKLKLHKVLKALGRIDFAILNSCPFLRKAASYAIIKAVK